LIASRAQDLLHNFSMISLTAARNTSPQPG
jgi:hypothetical protein